MFRFFNCLSVFVICILILTTPVFSQNNSDMSLVTVTGDAEIRVVPDEVILTLGVETWNQDLSEAKKENDKKIRDIFDFVKKLKIEEKHIQNAPGSDGIENSSTALGQIKINANVTVSFELEEK